MERDMKEAAQRRPAVYENLAFASATAMPFADASFNTVVSNCVIEHIPDLDSTLREIRRVLAPGGIFATTVPSHKYAEFLLGSTIFRKLGLQRLSRAYGDFFNRISYHYHTDSPEMWRERLESLGFRVLEQRYYFSPAAHRAFDLSHYLSVPNLVTKRLLGRWVLHPIQTKPFYWWMRKYYEEPWPDIGAYHFILARKE
jgi:SAM-dependent methyltransferase